jgi:hypothetical protein
MDGGDETSLVNVINNYYKPGPATNENMQSTMVRIEERDQYSPGNRLRSGDWYPTTARRPGKWYAAGNVVAGHADVTANNWLGMRGPEKLARVNTPFEAWPIHQQAAHAAYESVLAQAGATRPRRDAVDRRVIEIVRSGKPTVRDGIINDPKEVGGYPDYAFSADDVPPDVDGDGMSDKWENTQGLSHKDPSDGNTDSDRDGYTNVEEFLNGTNPREFIDYTKLENNVDTISGK